LAARFPAQFAWRSNGRPKLVAQGEAEALESRSGAELRTGCVLRPAGATPPRPPSSHAAAAAANSAPASSRSIYHARDNADKDKRQADKRRQHRQ